MIAPLIDNFRLKAALEYAAHGWHVFPLHHPRISSTSTKCSCGDDECGSCGKHPRTTSGFKEASTDSAVIRNWWASWPSANIGIATGAVSGIVVLDVDVKDEGDKTLDSIIDEHGELPETVESSTGGGGAHVVFAHPGRTVKNSVGKNGWLHCKGLDIRGDGGYIVAPPSQHSSGVRYAWNRGFAPGECSTSAMPAWLMAKLDASEYRPAPSPKTSTEDAGLHWLGKALAKCNEGNRNDTGLWLATQLRDNGISESDAESIMGEYADRTPRGENPYTRREASATTRGVYGTPPRDPAKSQSFASKVMKGIPKPKPTGASAELDEFIEDVAAGRIYNVPWPWPLMTRLTQALLPGTVTCVVGDPGVGKTFFILQCALFWYANAYDPAVFFIEKNRLFHVHRLLAQLEGNGKLIDLDWMKDNADTMRSASAKNRELINEVGQFVYSAPNERVTLDTLLNWVRQMASAGKRVIVVDPVTAVSAGNERWTKDEDFMMAAQAIMTAHGASLILTTHPKKGNRPGAPTGHDQAGGAAYYRFADTTVWLYKPKKPRKVKYQTKMGPTTGRMGLFFQFQKTRNGRGAGQEMVFTFGEGLQYVEQGLVIADLPDGDEAVSA